MTINPQQCRAARAILGWSQDQLAEAAKVARATVADFERGSRMPVQNNLAAMRSALETGGVLFIPGNGDGPGVRLRGGRLDECVSDLVQIGLRRQSKDRRFAAVERRVKAYMTSLAEAGADDARVAGYLADLKGRIHQELNRQGYSDDVRETLDYASGRLSISGRWKG